VVVDWATILVLTVLPVAALILLLLLVVTIITCNLRFERMY
jgi:hypothetical protein